MQAQTTHFKSQLGELDPAEITQQHKSKYECPTCGKRRDTKENTKIHEQTSQKENIFKFKCSSVLAECLERAV